MPDPAISGNPEDRPSALPERLHGFIREDGRLWLFLEKEDGASAYVLSDDLVAQIKGLVRRPTLAILAACESAGTRIHETTQQTAVRRTFGIQLVEAGVQAVIAMQGPISIDTMGIFGPKLLEGLGSVRAIDQAVAIARSHVMHQADWWVPSLLMRE